MDPDAGVDRNRRGEPDLFGPVVDPHLRVAERHDLAQHEWKQRHRQIAVRHGRPEWTFGGSFGIDVDPLVVVGRIGEEIDPFLVDCVPWTRAEVALTCLLEFCERHRRRHAVTPSFVKSARSALRSTLPTSVRGREGSTWISRGYL